MSAELQGVSADLSRSTGSFDSTDLGAIDAPRLAEVLAAMTLLAPPEGDDACWPNLVVHGPKGDFVFTLADGEGSLVDEDGNAVADIPAAVEAVTGEAYGGVVPTHRRGAARAKAKDSAEAAKAPRSLDGAARNLLELLDEPLRLSEYRRRFPHVVAGERSEEYRRLVSEILAADVRPELKARLQNHPPRYWALQRPGLFRRFLSLVVDVPTYFVMMGVGLVALDPAHGNQPLTTAQALPMLGWLLGSFLFYFLGLEWLLAATPGGLLTGLRVVDERGGRPSPLLCLKRFFLRGFRLVGFALTLFAASKQDTHHGMRTGMVAGGIASGGGDEVVLS